MRKTVYTIEYINGTILSDYQIEKLLDRVNSYNSSVCIPHTISKASLYVYTKSRNIPRFYKSITRQKLNDVLKVAKLGSVEYKKLFEDKSLQRISEQDMKKMVEHAFELISVVKSNQKEIC